MRIGCYQQKGKLIRRLDFWAQGGCSSGAGRIPTRLNRACTDTLEAVAVFMSRKMPVRQIVGTSREAIGWLIEQRTLTRENHAKMASEM